MEFRRKIFFLLDHAGCYQQRLGLAGRIFFLAKAAEYAGANGGGTPAFLRTAAKQGREEAVRGGCEESRRTGALRREIGTVRSLSWRDLGRLCGAFPR